MCGAQSARGVSHRDEAEEMVCTFLLSVCKAASGRCIVSWQSFINGRSSHLGLLFFGAELVGDEAGGDADTGPGHRAGAQQKF